MSMIGHVVYYKEDPENPASGFDAGAYVPIGHNWDHTLLAMAMDRPMATICVTPVTEVPGWVIT